MDLSATGGLGQIYWIQLIAFIKFSVLVEYHSFSCDPSDGSAWFFECVKQIRMQARQIELVERTVCSHISR